MGFYSSYYYFPAEIVAGTLLIEPFFAQIAGLILGQDHIPGIKTIVGLITSTLGFIIAGIGSSWKTESQLQSKLIENDNVEDIEHYERLD